MPIAFVSYVREDKSLVDRLVSDLESNGVEIWIDRKNLRPGERWPDAIRRGISGGDFFLACFSPNYLQRSKTYMNEELILAVEELRKRPIDTGWFIPIRLGACEIPARSIGAGETLNTLHRVDLFLDWDDGIRQILSVIRPQAAPIRVDRHDLAVFTHDIAVAVSGALLGLEVIQRRTPPDERQEKFMERLSSSLRIAVTQLRNFEAVTLALQEVPRIFRADVDLVQEIRDTARLLQPLARDRGLEFRIRRFGSDLRMISADRNLLRLVLLNVLDNAVKYSFPNGKITIKATRSRRSTVILEISNLGLPLSQDDLARIFERGFRGREARAVTTGGSGHGLFVARRIVQTHGGKISMRFDEKTKMDVVVIELPVDDRPASNPT
jgi:signal transduction histidine kinase